MMSRVDWPTGTWSLVDLTLPGGMLELPHPLLAGHVVLDGVGGRPVEAEKDSRPQPKVKSTMSSGMSVQVISRKAEFSKALPTSSGLLWQAFDREDDHHGGDEHGKEGAHSDKEERQPIDLAREFRSLFGHEGILKFIPRRLLQPKRPRSGVSGVRCATSRGSSRRAPAGHRRRHLERQHGAGGVLAQRGVVTETEQEELLGESADPPLAGLEEGQLEILRRVLDAVEVARDCGRRPSVR
ncbi:MAG: hypothetical protein R2862_06765 [Thermoanaerobaculia bacterium]